MFWLSLSAGVISLLVCAYIVIGRFDRGPEGIADIRPRKKFNTRKLRTDLGE